MDRRSLGIVAIILIGLMALVATAGLDNLPRQLRNSVTAAGTSFAADRTAFEQNRKFIDREIQEEPALFASQAPGWRERLDKDTAQMQSAALALAALQQLAKTNRRTDAQRVQQDLANFDNLRQRPLKDTSDIRTEAERWLAYKRALPQRMEAMRAAYHDLKEFDLDAATAPARKAMTDWPDKRADLQARLDALKTQQTESETIWDSTAVPRKAVESGDYAHIDYAGLFSTADRVDAAPKQLKDGAASLNTMAAQLYVNRDKLLLDVDGDREKVRIVTTRYPDATLAGGQTSSEERWETAGSTRGRDAERSVGMVIERKPAGKYDSEAERVVQPPAYAYIAPPGQSNSYGSWAGGVWHWLPEYLILSQLLHMSRGPVTAGDYQAYQQARRRGEVFYGRNGEFRPRWRGRDDGIGSRGTSVLRDWWSSRGDQATQTNRGSSPAPGWWKERPKPSWGDRAFSGSGYQSRGGFSGSRYSSRGSFGSRSYSRGFSARSFGRGGRR